MRDELETKRILRSGCCRLSFVPQPLGARNPLVARLDKRSTTLLFICECVSLPALGVGSRSPSRRFRVLHSPHTCMYVDFCRGLFIVLVKRDIFPKYGIIHSAN